MIDNGMHDGQRADKLFVVAGVALLILIVLAIALGLALAL